MINYNVTNDTMREVTITRVTKHEADSVMMPKLKPGDHYNLQKRIIICNNSKQFGGLSVPEKMGSCRIHG